MHLRICWSFWPSGHIADPYWAVHQPKSPRLRGCTLAICPLQVHPHLHCSRCRIQHLLFLNVVWLVIAQCYNLSRSLFKSSLPSREATASPHFIWSTLVFTVYSVKYMILLSHRVLLVWGRFPHTCSVYTLHRMLLHQPWPSRHGPPQDGTPSGPCRIWTRPGTPLVTPVLKTLVCIIICTAVGVCLQGAFSQLLSSVSCSVGSTQQYRAPAASWDCPTPWPSLPTCCQKLILSR